MVPNLLRLEKGMRYEPFSCYFHFGDGDPPYYCVWDYAHPDPQSALDGPATVTDTKITILCPPMNTIGNKNDKLDGTEEITCAGAYKTTAADVTAGLISSTATAHVGGQDSNAVKTDVGVALNNVLTISVTANPTSFNQVN